ncbi:MAG: hypothetical protein ACR2FH_00335 [Caulobacteraceae bacterium]
MRSPLLAGAANASAFLLAGLACAAQPASYPPPPELQNPDRAASANVQSAAEAPLHDLNLVRQKIPPILLAALADPYAPPRPRSCRTIVGEIRALSEALGGDFDEPTNPQNPSLTTQRGVALTLAHGVAESLLPFAGFVKTLSGAQKHDQLVAEVITAGSVRRGYLKGLGEAHACPPPATPHHLVFSAAPIQESRRPAYPIH